MALNMLPILPLDGGRVLDSLLPPKQSDTFSRLEPYGMILVVVLLVSGLLGYVLWPVVELVVAILPASDMVWPAIVSLFR
jgi:Zn-dependent protease